VVPTHGASKNPTGSPVRATRFDTRAPSRKASVSGLVRSDDPKHRQMTLLFGSQFQESAGTTSLARSAKTQVTNEKKQRLMKLFDSQREFSESAVTGVTWVLAGRC